MGNRMIRETLVESNKIAALSDFDFRLWVILILLADDYGVVDARPQIIKGFGYPLRDSVTANEIADALQHLEDGGCILRYTVDGKAYAQFPNWAKHQRMRYGKHRYPTIENADEKQARENSPRVAASCRELPRVAASRRETGKPAASCGKSPLEEEVEEEVEVDIEVEEEVEVEGKNRPTETEVREYAKQIGNAFFPAASFVSYYNKRKWKVNGKPILDWRAKVEEWIARHNDWQEGKTKDYPTFDYEQRDNSGYENFEFIDLDKYGEG